MSGLYFYRDGFARGRMFVEDREKDADGNLIVVRRELLPAHKGQKVQVSDPAYVLEKYPAFFSKRPRRAKSQNTF